MWDIAVDVALGSKLGEFFGSVECQERFGYGLSRVCWNEDLDFGGFGDEEEVVPFGTCNQVVSIQSN